MTTSTLHETCKDQLAKLAEANDAFSRRYPGDRPDRQPVHTVYGGAHLFKSVDRFVNSLFAGFL